MKNETNEEKKHTHKTHNPTEQKKLHTETQIITNEYTKLARLNGKPNTNDGIEHFLIIWIKSAYFVVRLTVMRCNACSQIGVQFSWLKSFKLLTSKFKKHEKKRISAL